ncbi:MAG: hypothetical protein KY444_00730, partial [Gemmatimonadetes bacterium]|nr:hypothetical protein [Gemmatimonadota bacterium]
MKQKTKMAAFAAGLASAGALATAFFAGTGAPQVSVEEVNPGTSVERSLCLSVSLAPAAASECGDLRLAHALPAVRTLGQARAPVLLYNSQHASPRPIVAANVTLPDGSSGLSRVTATLEVNGTPRALGVWRGSTWPAGTRPVRIAVDYDASSDATGPYRYTLEVKACYGTDCRATTAAGQLAVVNRHDSPFGAGWWLAGLERLVLDPAGRPALWVGGDGSTRRYIAARGDSVWGAPSLARPDTLKRAGAGWVRLLPGGARVEFDAAGRHVATINRPRHATRFEYDASGRLDRLSVPPAEAAGYRFVYGGDGRLARVEAPGAGAQARVTAVSRTGARVDSITDPDSTRVRFGYAGSGRVASRTDRRGYRTDFRFGAGNRVTGSKLWMDAEAQGDSIVLGLRAPEARGLAGPDGGGAVPRDSAYALIDGPRPDSDVLDHTRLWVNGWGAPTRIVDALGNESVIDRGDLRLPALPTRMRHPNGRVVAMEYDARGLAITSTDSSTFRVEPNGTRRYASTRYTWHPRWDGVTSITSAEGVLTTIAYDEATGNRLWEQVGPDSARRVRYTYETASGTAGLVAASRAPGATAADTVLYDALGNVRATRTPLGVYTLFYKDRLGRDTLVITPPGSAAADSVRMKTAGARQRMAYDAAGRVRESQSIGPEVRFPRAYQLAENPEVVLPTETLSVRNVYDAEGRALAVHRWSRPDTNSIDTITTRWVYDAAGRTVKEIAPGSGTWTVRATERVCENEIDLTTCSTVDSDSTYTVEYSDSTVYDPAGNAV